jgi:hypothetical protein
VRLGGPPYRSWVNVHFGDLRSAIGYSRSAAAPLAVQLLFGFNIAMKSAYELAMERLQKNAPVAPLTDEQRAEIAEIDSTYKAKIAEKELLLKDQIKKEAQAGNFKEVESLQQQLAMEMRRLQEEAESRKEKVRNRRR